MTSTNVDDRSPASAGVYRTTIILRVLVYEVMQDISTALYRYRYMHLINRTAAQEIGNRSASAKRGMGAAAY